MPVYATITLIMFLSSMGLPLLNGFVGEFTILQGAFIASKVWAIWAVPGVVLAAAYLLWLYQRVFFGTVTNPKNALLADLSGREIATFVPLVLLAFWMGIYPKPFFEILDQPVQELVLRVNSNPGVYNATVPGTVPTEAPTRVTTPAPITPATATTSAKPTTIAQERALEQ